MAFKMKEFSGFKSNGDPKKKSTATVGKVVGDVDNKLNDAYESGDMKAVKKALREINKDIKAVEKAGKGEELRDYINPSNYKNLNAYTKYTKEN